MDEPVSIGWYCVVGLEQMQQGIDGVLNQNSITVRYRECAKDCRIKVFMIMLRNMLPSPSTFIKVQNKLKKKYDLMLVVFFGVQILVKN